jgi:hypothetical protein
MVLGVLLYEGVDIMVHLGKITYNTARGIYYWYYNMEYPEEGRDKHLIQDMDKLVLRLEKLEGFISIEKIINEEK